MIMKHIENQFLLQIQSIIKIKLKIYKINYLSKNKKLSRIKVYMIKLLFKLKSKKINIYNKYNIFTIFSKFKTRNFKKFNYNFKMKKVSISIDKKNTSKVIL